MNFTKSTRFISNTESYQKPATGLNGASNATVATKRKTEQRNTIDTGGIAAAVAAAAVMTTMKRRSRYHNLSLKQLNKRLRNTKGSLPLTISIDHSIRPATYTALATTPHSKYAIKKANRKIPPQLLHLHYHLKRMIANESPG